MIRKIAKTLVTGETIKAPVAKFEARQGHKVVDEVFQQSIVIVTASLSPPSFPGGSSSPAGVWQTKMPKTI